MSTVPLRGCSPPLHVTIAKSTHLILHREPRVFCIYKLFADWKLFFTFIQNCELCSEYCYILFDKNTVHRLILSLSCHHH